MCAFAIMSCSQHIVGFGHLSPVGRDFAAPACPRHRWRRESDGGKQREGGVGVDGGGGYLEA